MRIGFFSYLPLEYGGGVAKYFIEIATGLKLRYKDIDTGIITFNRKTLKAVLFAYWLYFLGAQDKSLSAKEKKNVIGSKLGTVSYHKVGLFALRRELQKYDLIYSTNNLLEVLTLKYLIGYEDLPPVIYGFHIPPSYPRAQSLQSKLHNIIYRTPTYLAALKGARSLHVLNGFDEGWLKRKSSGPKVFKIYNPFDFDAFESLSNKYVYKFKRTSKKFNILWVGRLSAQKGVDNLVELVNHINSSTNKDLVVWNIVGEGELRKEISKLRVRWDNVDFHSYVQNKYLPSIYKNSNLFISTSHWESFPYNLLEAQSVGLPAVAFDIPGCNEIIEDGKNGYLVSNINSFSSRVKLFLEGQGMKKSEIKQFIRIKFNEDDIFDQIYGLFSQ